MIVSESLSLKSSRCKPGGEIQAGIEEATASPTEDQLEVLLDARNSARTACGVLMLIIA